MAMALRFGRAKDRQTSSRRDNPIVNSVDEAVIATDLTGKVVFWNRVAEKVYGWKWEEAIGRPVADLIVPLSEQPGGKKIMERLRRGESWTGEFRLRRRDGSEFIGIVTDEPMRDGKGNLIGIIGTSRVSSKKNPTGKRKCISAKVRS